MQHEGHGARGEHNTTCNHESPAETPKQVWMHHEERQEEPQVAKGRIRQQHGHVTDHNMRCHFWLVTEADCKRYGVEERLCLKQ